MWLPPAHHEIVNEVQQKNKACKAEGNHSPTWKSASSEGNKTPTAFHRRTQRAGNQSLPWDGECSSGIYCHCHVEVEQKSNFPPTYYRSRTDRRRHQTVSRTLQTTIMAQPGVEKRNNCTPDSIKLHASCARLAERI